MPLRQTRRRLLTTFSLAGAAGLMRAPAALAAEGSLETTTVRISKDLAVCEAPLGIASELLRAEDFTEIRYVDTSADDLSAAIAQRKVDFALDFPCCLLRRLTPGNRSRCWLASMSAASSCSRRGPFIRLPI
jgi:NitT/TauT family transport system substrate-binding protein